MIGIIGAMDIEVAALIERLEQPVQRTVSGLVFYSGSLCGRDAVVVRGGVGKVNAAMCAEAMLLCFRPKLVVNVGVAGAMTPGFQIGDIALARDLVQYDVDTTPLGDPIGMVSTVNRVDFPCAPWAVDAIDAAARADGLRVKRIRIASGDRFNDSAEDKRLIVSRFGAEASEMEGCPIAQVCWINGVDCAVIRAISDLTDGEHGAEYARYRDTAVESATRALLAFLNSPAAAGL